MNCLLTATLGLDLSLLDRLAASIDYPVQSKVVINNGRPDALDKWNQSHPDWTVFTSGENVGCAGAWNAAPMLWPGEKAYLIVNDDVAFGPGMLESVYRASDQSSAEAHFIFLVPESFHVFVWTRKGVRDFGLFDENLWPAYFEDTEMKSRCRAGNAKSMTIGGLSSGLTHDKPKPNGQVYYEMIHQCWILNDDYYLRKWGDGKFKTPFNDPLRPLAYWKLERDGRSKRQQFWDAFWNQSNPSIYE